MNTSEKPSRPPPAKSTEKDRPPQNKVIYQLPDELVPKLLEKGIVEVSESQVQRVIISSYQGPLPPPDQLAKYNLAVPNAAERIMAMAEREQSHAHNVQNKALADLQDNTSRIISTESRNSLLGIVSALLISLVSIVGGFYVTTLGSIATQITGGIISFTGLTTLVGVFIYGSSTGKRQKEELKTPPAALQNVASSSKK